MHIKFVLLTEFPMLKFYHMLVEILYGNCCLVVNLCIAILLFAAHNSLCCPLQLKLSFIKYLNYGFPET